ncbi:Mur ligase family protein [Patescibacteria group bacterium]
MVHFLELIYFLFILKAILRCLYFWQLKEYRFDRIKDLINTKEAKKFLLPTKSLLRPRLTLKILLLIYLSFIFSFQILKINYQVLAPLAAYFLIPLTTSLSVILLKPLTSLFYDLVIFLAKLKLSLFYKNLTIIGITGSYAKTSTKEILDHLLSQKYKVLKTPGTQNTAIGVALTILKKLKISHQVFIVEMGAYKTGEIKQICQLVRPQIGILTGIIQQHLSLFKNFENIKKAKYELIQSLPQDGLAVFNGENYHTLTLAKKTKHLKTIIYHYPKKPFSTNLLGNYQQLNIQAAVIVAKHLKIKQNQIKKALNNIPEFKTMITKQKGFNQATILNDSYNSNPEGFQQAIKLAKQSKLSQKILITSGIIELGKDSKKIHQQLLKQAVTVFDKVFITKEHANVFQHKKIIFQPDYQKITAKLKTRINNKTLILLESRLPQKFINQLYV